MYSIYVFNLVIFCVSLSVLYYELQRFTYYDRRIKNNVLESLVLFITFMNETIS